LSAAARPIPWPGLAGHVGRRPRAGAWLPFALVVGAALGATLAVPVLPPLRFAYPAPELRVALETGAALAGMLAAVIVARGWRDGARLDRLAIAAGLATMALTSAALTGMLALGGTGGPRAVIAVSGTLVGSLLLAAGAFLPARRPRRTGVAVATIAAAAVVACGVVAATVAVALEGLPAPPPSLDLARPQLIQPVEALAFQIVMVLSFAVAAVGLAVRGVGTGDRFVRRLGLAVVLYAFAKLHYLLLPPIGAEWVHAGDVLRLLYCAVVLWAAAAELAGKLATDAAARERRRIARDLHDGVAQELAYIQRRAARLQGLPGAEIAGAAERALLDSRWAIEHLARPPDEPLDRVLARHASVIAARSGVEVSFSASGTVEAGPEVREALVRILGEAVANARHGNATRVHVSLSSEPLRLRVIDDGAGFDAGAGAPGFGLGGMRERAALVGARLRVRSGPGAGTEVAVELS
jgi:signal transduction histidine kinase